MTAPKATAIGLAYTTGVMRGAQASLGARVRLAPCTAPHPKVTHLRY